MKKYGQNSSSELSQETYERRIFKRRQLIYYLELFDDKDRRCIGHVVDISPEGMLVMSERPFGMHQVYHFIIAYKREPLKRELFQVTARSRWCMPGMHAHFYDTGFELIRLDRHASEALDFIMKTICF